MSKSIFSFLIFALSIPGLAQAQLGEVSCDDSARLTQTLVHVMGAERRGMGLRDPETTLEIWVTPSTAAWVIVQNYANGTSCIVAMGDHWEEVSGARDPS